MSLIKTAAGLRVWFAQTERKNKTLGFVPTMGCLHDGHLSLIKASKKDNKLTVVSVFVNPTQFAPGEDFESYPRNIERDYELAIKAGADAVYHPCAEDIYCPGAASRVEVTGEIAKKLCGASRPTHFSGVTTVVNILLNAVGPDRVYFGQKDAQQALIIKKMITDLKIPVQMITCPIVREHDGLAMSSRNVFLSSQERQQAVCLSESLESARQYLASGADDHNEVKKLTDIVKCHISKHDLAMIDYVQLLDAQTLESVECVEHGRQVLAAVAVKFGKTRLIDNCILSL